MRRMVDLLYWRTAGGAHQTLLTWIGVAGLLAMLLPCLNCLQRGQVEVLKLYLLLVGFRVFLTGRSPRAWFLSGVVFAGAGILKLTPLLPVACLILYDLVLSLAHRWDRLPRLRAASLTAGLGSGALLFALLLPASFIGWSANWHHLGTWFSGVVTKVIDVRTSDFGEDVRTVRNQSLDNSAYRFGNWFYAQFADGPDDTIIDRPHRGTVWLPMDTPFAGEMINLARLFAFAMLLLFVVQAARRDQPLGRAAVFGLACVATLVVCPVARGCYFALFLPAIIFVSMWLLQLGRPRTAMVLSIVPVVAIWLHYVAVTFSGRIGLLGLCTAAWFLGTCAILDKCLATRRSDPKCVKLAIPANLKLLEPV
jgi:Glycosyltransferase family 87